MFSFLLGALFSAVLIIALSTILFGGKFITEKKFDRLQTIESEYGKYYDMQKIIANQSYYKVNMAGLDKSIAEDILSTVDDRYASYMTEKEYKSFEKKYITSYSGVGVVLKTDEDNKIYVNRILPGSPAEKAKLAVGDKLLKINDETVNSLDDATKLIEQKSDTTTFTIERGGEVKEFDIKKTNIEDNGVSYEIADAEKSIAMIRITTFRKGTAKALDHALKDLEAKDCKGVIFDLRGNGGGVVDEAFKSADLMIDKVNMGTVISKKGKKNYTAQKGKFDFETYTLVDGDTASAAEIFASILKSNGDKIIGNKTFGKGVIQTVFKVEDGSVIKLTTAEYLLPNGKKLNEKGVVPDIAIAQGDIPIDKAVELLKKQIDKKRK